MKIKQTKIEELIPYVNNARTHSDIQISQIAASIKEFGFNNPVLTDGDNGIIAGHGRVLAARKLNIDTVPTIELKHLSNTQKKAYILADNKLAENAGWDMELVNLELESLSMDEFDLDLTGFELEPEEKQGLTDEDAVPEVDEPVTKMGDLWILGEHRLLCGDSTDIEQVERLMDGGKADMVFTDPPYNIDYQGVKDKREKIKNDKMSDADFVRFLEKSLLGCETMYVCCSWQYAALFKQAMENISRKPKAMIVWNKVNPAQHLDKYFKQHELIFYYGDFGGHKTLRGDVWEIKRQKNTVHPTMKPVELISIALHDQPDKTIVYDSFLGSGSTLIACEKTNRKCYGMELDPHYTDVCLQRWADYTGGDPIREDGKKWSELTNN